MRIAGGLDGILVDATAIADAVRDRPRATVACYAGWDLAALARHVGQVHRWVSGIVETRASERPTGGYPPAPDDDGELGDWVGVGAGRLVEVLRAVRHDEPVWTISRTWRDVAFWRRRMVLETALHRWDAERALGRTYQPDHAVATAGVAEALDVYLAQRLDPEAVAGAGQRVAFVPAMGEGWTLALGVDAITVDDGADSPDATVRGSALDLWLLLTCRRGLDGLEVEGDVAAAELAVHAATLSPGPAG